MVVSRVNSAGSLASKPGKDVRKSVKHEIGDIDADTDERNQFDNGFDGDGRHQSFMPFRGNQMPGAENNAENTQDKS